MNTSNYFELAELAEARAVARSECNTVIELKQEHHGA